MLKRLLLAAGLVLMPWGMSADEAGAATATTTFQVVANVLVACTITATDMNFGDYTGVKINVQSQMLVKCTNTAQWNIGLSPGTAPGATVNDRKMTGPGGSLLSYQISPDPSQGYSWGAPLDPNSLSGTGSGTAQVVTAYGVLFAGQNTAVPGGYVDTLTATISF